MAISYVGGNSNTAINAQSVTVSLTALTGGSDSSPTAGDLILVCWSCGDDDFTQPTLAMTTGGYTELTTSTLSVDGGTAGDANLAVFYKFHVSDTSVVTAASGTGTDSSNAVAVQVFRGVDSDTGPLEIAIQTNTGASGSDPDPPQVSGFTEATSAVVIAGATSAGTTPTLTAPTNYTTNAVLPAVPSEVWRAAAGLAYRLSGASDPEDPGAFTSSGTGAWAAATMVLKATSAANATATPSVIAVSSAVGSTTLLAAAITTPAVIPISASVPAPTLLATAITGVSTIAATISLPAPTIIAEGGAVETGWSETGEFYTVSVSESGRYPAASDTLSETGEWLGSLAAAAGNATATPATIAVSASIPAPTVLAAAQATPPVVAAVAAVPAPTIQAAATATPATVAVTSSVPVPTVQASAIVTPTTVGVTASVPTPSVLVGGNVTVPATTIAVSASVGAPTVQGAVQATPTTVGVSASVGAPTVQAAARPTPTTVGISAAVGAPTVSGTAVVTPTTIAVAASVPAPAILVGGNVTIQPSTISISASVGAPTVLGTARVTPSTVAVTASVGAATLKSDQATTPATIAVSASVLAPSVRGTAVVQGLTITGVVGLPPPIVFGGAIGVPVKGPTQADELEDENEIEALISPNRFVRVGANSAEVL